MRWTYSLVFTIDWNKLKMVWKEVARESRFQIHHLLDPECLQRVECARLFCWKRFEQSVVKQESCSQIQNTVFLPLESLHKFGALDLLCVFDLLLDQSKENKRFYIRKTPASSKPVHQPHKISICERRGSSRTIDDDCRQYVRLPNYFYPDPASQFWKSFSFGTSVSFDGNLKRDFRVWTWKEITFVTKFRSEGKSRSPFAFGLTVLS